MYLSLNGSEAKIGTCDTSRSEDAGLESPSSSCLSLHFDSPPPPLHASPPALSGGHAATTVVLRQYNTLGFPLVLFP